MKEVNFLSLLLMLLGSITLADHWNGTLRSKEARPDLFLLLCALGRVVSGLPRFLVVACLTIDAGALSICRCPGLTFMPVESFDESLLFLVITLDGVVRAVGFVLCDLLRTGPFLGRHWARDNRRLEHVRRDSEPTFHSAN